MKSFLPFLLLLGLLFPLSGNAQTYNFDSPHQTWELPSILKEVSGLSCLENGDLAMIQDEDGLLFYFNIQQGVVVDTFNFWGSGDYEGVEIVGNYAYILKSDADIFRYDLTTGEAIKESYKSLENQEWEGLGYDRKSNTLVIASKAGAEKYAKDREVWRIRIPSLELIAPAPIFLNEAVLKGYCESLPQGSQRAKLETKLCSPQEKGFCPSAIAQHPISGNWFLLSSIGKALMVLSPDGEILDLVKLNRAVIPQPEGLCFDAQGTLYLSTEGKEGPARLFQFLGQ